MRTDYHERRQKKIERSRELADKNNAQADARFDNAHQLGAMIPFGQPILVGHHSEKTHRRHIKKIDDNMRKGFELRDKADFHEARADRLEKNYDISSDDPEAIVRLKEKLAQLVAFQNEMKEANKKQRGSYPSFTLTNNNARIKSVKQRIDQLEKLNALETTEETINGVRILRNVPANRIQLFFESKPAEAIRQMLKHAGFHWSPSQGAWQRQITDAAERLAKQIAQSIETEKEAS